MAKILIADPHALVRKGLAQILANGDPDTIHVDEAESGEEALRMAGHNDYDLVLLDIFIPGKGGIDVVKELKSSAPEVPVVIISKHEEAHCAVRALRAGAAGFLTTGNAEDELPGAVRKVLAGDKYISQSLAEKLAFGFAGSSGYPPHEGLSDREFQVLRMIASGKTPRAMAREMSLSVKTINTYRTRLLHKMGMKSNAELTHYAIRHDLVD
jgi:two-component system, NarL family, invasion response regulator UvrY